MQCLESVHFKKKSKKHETEIFQQFIMTVTRSKTGWNKLHTSFHLVLIQLSFDKFPPNLKTIWNESTNFLDMAIKLQDPISSRKNSETSMDDQNDYISSKLKNEIHTEMVMSLHWPKNVL